MSHSRILIMHPEAPVAALMTSMLQTLGHTIDEAPNDRVAMRMLERAPVDLVLAGADPDDPDALEFLTYLRRKHPRVAVILLFPTAHPERAREAQIRGAIAVLRFPLPANALRAAVSQVLGEADPVAAKVAAASSNGHTSSPTNGHANGAQPGAETVEGNGPGRSRVMFEPPVSAPLPAPSIRDEDPMDLVGEDPSFRMAVELAGAIAATRAPVLIVGERGVGKSLLARFLHARQLQAAAPFVEVACGALKEGVLDVDLFGARGGYGAPDRPGKIALARGGTLFLDEVASLSPALQNKMLRLLRDGEYDSVGGVAAKADVRLVLGTSEDLATRVEDGRFRQDLYFKISVVTLTLPPLRHRGSDLDRLAERFRVKFSRQLNKDVRAFAPEALELLRTHGWPGNVQELEQVVERAVIVCRGSRIEPNHLGLVPRSVSIGRAPARPSQPQVDAGIIPLKEALEGPEKELILQALEALNWNRQETARVLDINRTTLYKKMKKYGLLFDEPAWAN